MTDPAPRERAEDSRATTPGALGRVTPQRITTWLVVGGIGVFLIVSGITGIIAKG